MVENGKLEGVSIDDSVGALIVSTTGELQSFLEQYGREADLWLDEEDDLLLNRQ